MKLRRLRVVRDASGFTLIELLYTLMIMGILASLAVVYMGMYIDDAEYAKAEADLRNAQTSLIVAEDDVPVGFTVANAATGTEGGNVPAAMGAYMPGATTSKDVRLVVRFRNCMGEPALRENYYIAAQPCHSDRYLTVTRFCGGITVWQRDAAKDYEC